MIKQTINKILKYIAEQRPIIINDTIESESYFKKLAICISSDMDFPDITLWESMVDILIFNKQNNTCEIQNQIYSWEELPSIYEYIWFSPRLELPFSEMIANILLRLSKNKPDFILLGFQLKDPPDIGFISSDPTASIVMNSQRVTGFKKFNFADAYGEFQRFFVENTEGFLVEKFEIFFNSYLEISNPLHYTAKELFFDNAVPTMPQNQKFIANYSKPTDKPTILVLPAFLMVGGVERNTIGVMEELKDQYHFVMVVFDGLLEKQGSMHHQARLCTDIIFDFYESLSYHEYLSALRDIRDIYLPDIIWICNGSNWLCENTLNIKKIFLNTPILDQEVYDTNVGWITCYTEPRIETFDRIIAINTKIYSTFVNQYNISSNKIDIIYPMVNLNITSGSKKADKQIYLEKYNIPQNKKIFAFIGRLFSQKRPKAFIELIESINQKDPSFHFLLIGNGELKPIILEMIGDKKIENITMIDFVNDMSEIYCFLDGLIMVSEYEGLPIVVLESLLNGIPVLSTDVGDVKLVVNEYEGGKIFESGNLVDIPSMTENFFEFEKNLPYYKEKLDKEHPKILDRFSSKSIAEKWNESFQLALKEKQGEEY